VVNTIGDESTRIRKANDTGHGTIDTHDTLLSSTVEVGGLA
jgi:hypothetical protein